MCSMDAPRWSWPAGDEPAQIMGVLNLTPDSFSDGGLWLEPNRAVDRALEMVDEGADIIDVGGESSRPGAAPVSVEEELERVVPVLEALRSRSSVPISVDTTKAEVAYQCLALGAEIINDIGGLRNASLRKVVSEAQAGVVLMHMRGVPATMQQGDLSDEDVVGSTLQWLRKQTERAEEAGISPRAICIDPGIGFGKTVAQNCQLIAQLPRLTALGYPLLIGVSRKSFLGAITGAPVDARAWAGAAAQSCALLLGAKVIRTHDVHAAREQALVAHAIRTAQAE